MSDPAIPTLEQVKQIIGDRTKSWSDVELLAALAFVEVLSERAPPLPCLGGDYSDHKKTCAWLRAPGESLCTCDPKHPR